jgi:hypothetical protein
VILTPTSAFNGSGGTISAMIKETSGPFNLTWSNNVNGQTGYYLTGLTAGTYSLTVSGTNGCQQFVTANVGNIISSSTTVTYIYSSGSSVRTDSTSFSLQSMMYSGYTNLTQNASKLETNNSFLSNEVTNLKQTENELVLSKQLLEKELLRFKKFEMLSVTLKNENNLFKEKESKLESEIANLLIKSADDFRLIEKAQQEKLEYESKLNVLNQEIQVKQNTLESEVKEKNDLLEQVKNLSQTLKYENRLKKKNEEKIK